MIVPEHVGAPIPTFQTLVYPRKQCSRRETLRSSHKTSIDVRNQVVYCIKPESGKIVKTSGGGSDDDNSDKNEDINGNDTGKNVTTTNVDVSRKGRPKGSKNKTSTCNSFNNQCEKRSFTYSFTSPVKCKLCDRPINGDPVLHCLENHKTVCPICGGTYKPPLTAHIKSHGIKQIELTVMCYECYDCKEKFGNAATMMDHVMDEHVSNASVTKNMICCICDTAFLNIDRLREHVSMAHVGAADTGNFPDHCAYCDTKTGQTAIAGHVVEKHLQKTIVDLKCMLCNVQFGDQAAIADHLVAEHCPQKTFSHPAVYRCRVCHAGFKSQINVLRHACNKIKMPHCEQCGKTFPSKMRYAFHLQFHEHPKYAPMHLHCDLCLAEFEDEYQLYDHIRFRHELHDKAVCEICGRTFKSSMGLNIHRRYHNGLRNFTCKSCDKSFLNKSTLREHEISHMDVKPFQCHICGQYLSRASRLRSHVKTHKAAESTEQKCYSCVSCGFVAPGPRSLAEHANKEHSGGNIQTNVVQLSSVVKCEFCDSTYVDARYLNDHREVAHVNCDNSEAFICVVCSSTFSTYSRLTTHKLTHGINMESALVSEESSENVDPDRFNIPQFFSCQYCAKMCLHYTYFCLHRRLKHPLGVQAYTCDRCFLDFKTSWRLSYHKKTVHGQSAVEKPSEKYKCTVCSRKFIKIGALNLHKTRTHIDIVGDICKYLCHQCGKFFSSECSLKNHSKVHGDTNGGERDASGELRNPVVVTQRNRYRTYRKPTGNIKSAKIKKPHPYFIQPDALPNDKSSMSTQLTFPATVAVGEPKIENPHVPYNPHNNMTEPQVRTSFPAADAVNKLYSYSTQTVFANESQPASFVERVNGQVQQCNELIIASSIVCELCDNNFNDSAQLKVHLESHATSNECFLCKSCYATFLSLVTFDTHVITHAPPADATCIVQPNVRFIGVPKNVSSAVPLIVDCSKIFNEQASRIAVDHEPPLKQEIMPIASNIKSPESRVLDELLAIISTPRTSSILETIEYNRPMEAINDIDDLIKSIGN